MPRKSSMKPINLDEEKVEDEDDAAITAEEAQLRAAHLQRELEEQNKFDCLCDGVNSAISLVDSAFNGLLELKDELLMHGLPPSFLASLVLVTGKMYRSITDLHTPVRELTRLVSIYSVPWEQKSEQLKKLHMDYESKQRQLNIAIRKLQLIDAAARRLEREKVVNNWEKVFSKVSAAKTHGRRWKFMIEAFKQKVKEGIIPGDLEVDDDDDDDDDDYSDRSESHFLKKKDEEEEDQDEAVTDKQRFMMSVITASPPQEEDTGSHPAASELGSDADGIPSEVTESSENAAEMSPDLQPKKRHGVSFGPASEADEPVVVKPEMKDASSWTEEPEYETMLAIRVYKPLEMMDDKSDISCSLTLEGETKQTGVFPHLPPATETVSAVEEQQEKTQETPIADRPEASRRKSIGFASRPSSPPPSSPGKAKPSKPSSILKKIRSPTDEETDETKEKTKEFPTIDRTIYKQVEFSLPDDLNDSIKIAILEGEKNSIISMAIFPLSDLNMQQLPVKYMKEPCQTEREEDSKDTKIDVEENVEEKSHDEAVSESEILASDPIFVDLQGIKLGIGGHSHSHMGRLPLVFYVIKKEIKRFADKEVSTETIKELVKDVAGVDIDEISKDDLVAMLGREYHDVCTSAMSFTSSASSRKSGYIANEELEAIQEQHEKELHELQAEYEVKLQQLILELEQQSQFRSHIPADLATTQSPQLVDVGKADHEGHVREVSDVRFAEEEIQQEVTPRRKFPRGPVLPDWGAHLPKNVWVRMKILTEEMIEKRHQLEARVRRQISSNIEKKLASQYKLQRANNTLRGPLQDVSLPAVFMPSRSGNVYNPRAHMYFHPTGTSGDLRLSQPPSIFQLPPLPEKARVSVVNLFDLSKNFQQNASLDWLTRIATVPQQKGSRATTAATRASRLATPNTPAPTANMPAFES